MVTEQITTPAPGRACRPDSRVISEAMRVVRKRLRRAGAVVLEPGRETRGALLNQVHGISPSAPDRRSARSGEYRMVSQNARRDKVAGVSLIAGSRAAREDRQRRSVLAAASTRRAPSRRSAQLAHGAGSDRTPRSVVACFRRDRSERSRQAFGIAGKPAFPDRQGPRYSPRKSDGSRCERSVLRRRRSCRSPAGIRRCGRLRRVSGRRSIGVNVPNASSRTWPHPRATRSRKGPARIWALIGASAATPTGTVNAGNPVTDATVVGAERVERRLC